MKKIYIKVALLLCILIFIPSAMEGCSGVKNKGIEDTILKTDLKTDKLNSTELTFYMLGNEKEDAKEVLDKIAAASELNIKLNFKWYGYDSYFKKVKAAFASNESFDAFICGRADQDTLDINSMFKNGQIKDITDLLPKYAPVIYKQLSDEGLLDAAKVDGKYIFVPSLYPSVNVLGVFIKKDLADKYGITAINTLKDYDSFLRSIKENEKEVFPGLIAGGDAYDISFYANSYGYAVLDYSQNLVYKWDDPDMKIIPWEQTPEFKETTGFVSSWFKNGYMEREAVQGKKVASFICKTGSLSEGAQNIDFYSDGNQEIYNLYILYKDKKIQRGSPLNDSPFGVVAFNSNSQNVERALMFLNWIQSNQENYDLFNYGIKGRHYTLKGERIDMPEGMTPDSNPYWWHGFDDELLNYAFMNIDFHRPSVYDTNDDNYKSDYLKFVKTNTSYAPHEGFYPDYANIKDDCLKRMQLYSLEVKDAFQSGTFDINKTDSIIEDLDGAGTGLIVNEIQKQLNHWRSVNKK